MKLFSRLLLLLASLGLLAPAAVEAGGGDDQKGHHDHHSGHMNMGDSYPSTMFMGKTTFVLGGVDGEMILEWVECLLLRRRMGQFFITIQS